MCMNMPNKDVIAIPGFELAIYVSVSYVTINYCLLLLACYNQLNNQLAVLGYNHSVYSLSIFITSCLECVFSLNIIHTYS